MSIIVLTEAERRFDLLPWLIQLESIGNCTGTNADIQAVTRSILRIGIVARRERDEAQTALAIAQTFLKAQREQKRLMLHELHRLEDENGRLRKELDAAAENVSRVCRERNEARERLECVQGKNRILAAILAIAEGERDKLAAELQESELFGPFGDTLQDLYEFHEDEAHNLDNVVSAPGDINLYRLKSLAYLSVLAYFHAREDERRAAEDEQLDPETGDDGEAEVYADPEDLDDPDACEGLDEEACPTCEQLEAEAEAARKFRGAECNEACCGKLSRMEEAMKKASGHP